MLTSQPPSPFCDGQQLTVNIGKQLKDGNRPMQTSFTYLSMEWLFHLEFGSAISEHRHLCWSGTVSLDFWGRFERSFEKVPCRHWDAFATVCFCSHYSPIGFWFYRISRRIFSTWASRIARMIEVRLRGQCAMSSYLQRANERCKYENWQFIVRKKWFWFWTHSSVGTLVLARATGAAWLLVGAAVKLVTFSPSLLSWSTNESTSLALPPSFRAFRVGAGFLREVKPNLVLILFFRCSD